MSMKISYEHRSFRPVCLFHISWYLIALFCRYLLVLISSLVEETNRPLVVHDCYVIFALSHWPALVVKTNEYQWVPRQKCYKISAIAHHISRIYMYEMWIKIKNRMQINEKNVKKLFYFIEHWPTKYCVGNFLSWAMWLEQDNAIAPITSLKIGNFYLFKTLPGKLYEPPLHSLSATYDRDRQPLDPRYCFTNPPILSGAKSNIVGPGTKRQYRYRHNEKK